MLNNCTGTRILKNKTNIRISFILTSIFGLVRVSKSIIRKL